MQADAFIQLLDSLNVEKAVVFGGSAGALPAMAFAIRHPERCRALVLLVPAAYAPTRKPKTSGAEGPLLEGIVSTLLSSDFLFWSMQKAMPGTMARILLATDPSVIAAAPPPEQARFWTTMRHILPVNSRRDGILFDMAHAGDPPEMDLSAIRCPVLAISARDDMFGTAAPAEYIAANVPDGRSVVYDSGGHLWMGHQDEVWAEVTSFLAPLRDRGAAGVARAVP
jgi:pimeloyl-ACP methyl ester carboxylesterase